MMPYEWNSTRQSVIIDTTAPSVETTPPLKSSLPMNSFVESTLNEVKRLEFADAQGTLVITFGVDNTEEDIIRFLTVL